MTYADFSKLCSNRRSIRYFDAKPVSKNEILELLELARIAPSVENTQPWHFHVITKKELIAEIEKCSCYGNFVVGSGVFIVVTCNRTVQNAVPQPLWNERELDYSCVTAMEHILLGATAMGLGSCIVSLHHGPVHELLKLPRHEVIVNGIMVGHYKPGEEHSNDGRQRKDLDEIYTFHE